MSAPAFTAPCQSCGGALSLVLAGDEPPCSYCGQPFAVDAALAGKLRTLRQAIAVRDARKEQLIGRQAHLGRTHGPWLLVMPGSVWAIAYFSMWFMIDTPGVGFAAVMFEPSAGDTAHKAWLVSALTMGVGLNLIVFGIALARARRVIRHAFPIAPAAEGRPPRCRVCNGELAGEGRVQTCPSCAADHLVLGQYQRADAELSRALADRGRELDTSLEARSAAVWRGLTVGVGLSLGTVVVAPVVLLFGPYPPLAFTVALGVVGLGVAIVAFAATRPVPHVRTFDEAIFGDRVNFDGEELVAWGGLRLPMPEGRQSAYVMILGDATGAPRIAIEMSVNDAEIANTDLTMYELTPGGAPLTAAQAASLIPLNRDRRIVAGPLAATAPLGRLDRGDASVWLQAPATDEAPWFTSSLPRRVGRDKLAFRTTLTT